MPFVSVDSFEIAPQIDRRTLTDSVYVHLREQLAVGGLVPGERLSLRELGSEMGVSVMPVREAVNRLGAERALEVTAARVLRVPLTTVQQIRDLTEIRLVVEGFATERAALLRTQAEMDAIDVAADALDSMALRTPGNAGGWIAMNRNLHFTIYQAARLPLLVKMIGDLWLRAGPVLNHDLRAGSQRHVMPDIARYHADAVAAIRAGDPVAARLAIAGDISNAAAYIIRNGHWLKD
jgi:DNA-binding GntR family transcriptional regulator